MFGVAACTSRAHSAIIPRAVTGGCTNARVIVLPSHGPGGVVPHRRRRACHRILVRWVGPGPRPCFGDGQWGRLRYLGDAVRRDGNTFAAVGLHVSRSRNAAVLIPRTFYGPFAIYIPLEHVTCGRAT